MIDLTTHADWSEHYFNQFYLGHYQSADIQEHMFQANEHQKAALWISNPENQIWQEGIEIFDLGNGLSVFKKYDDFDDVYSFFSTRENHKINNFYISNMDVFERFIEYFQNKAMHLIDKNNKQRLILPGHFNDDEEQKSNHSYSAKELFESLSKNGFSLGKQYNYQTLTKRELECLSWLFIGKSASEIGLILECSPRTVEKHIDNIKVKLNCTRATQLIYVASKIGMQRWCDLIRNY